MKMELLTRLFLTFERQKLRLIVGSEQMLDPKKWGLLAKCWTTFLMCANSFIVYMGASIYSPSISGVQEQYKVSRLEAGLPFSLYVAAWGISSLALSPVCEVPRIGRNIPYMFSLAAFVCFAYAAAVAPNFAALVGLRFIQSLLGSVVLSTGGSTLSDLFYKRDLPYLICSWASFFWAGPAVGPLVSYVSIPETGWRWSLWEVAWAASPMLLLLVLTLPETSKDTLILRYGSLSPVSAGCASSVEEEKGGSTTTNMVQQNWYKYFSLPFLIFVLDPSVLYADLYMSFCYSIYFSFFEAFPIVFQTSYGFSMQSLGVVFMVIPVGVALGHLTFVMHYRRILLPAAQKGKDSPESILDASLITILLIPAGLFIFAFTSRPGIHWVAPLVGVLLYLVGVYCLNQAILSYLAQAYPQFAGSVFAMNQFLRALFAFAQVIISVPLYKNLGIEKGVSVLGALTVGLSPGMLVLRIWGPKLRAMSRFSYSTK